MLLWVASHTAAESFSRVLDRRSVEEETVVKLVHLFQKVGGMRMPVRSRGELAVFLRLVATEHKDVADAQELEIEQLIFDVFLRRTATDDVRDDWYVVFVLDGAGDGNSARAATHTLTSEETVFQFLIYTRCGVWLC